MAQRAVIEVFEALENGYDDDGKVEEEKESEEVSDQIMEDDLDDDFDTQTVISDIESSNQVFVSMYQIYNENVNDLLKSNAKAVAANLQLRQGANKMFYVQGLV